jgi:hypothetical protein
MALGTLFAQTTRKAPSAPMRETFVAPKILLVIPDLDSSPSALGDASRRTPDRERGPRNLTSASSGTGCLRCGGLLVLSYMASLESDLTGRPMRLWRCVNCGDCVDRDILANRWNGPMPPARASADSRANIVFQQPVKNGVLEVRMPKTEEAKKNAITVTIDHVLVSRVSSHERSSRHG